VNTLLKVNKKKCHVHGRNYTPFSSPAHQWQSWDFFHFFLGGFGGRGAMTWMRDSLSAWSLPMHLYNITLVTYAYRISHRY
jgi:hypothetical protein